MGRGWTRKLRNVTGFAENISGKNENTYIIVGVRVMNNWGLTVPFYPKRPYSAPEFLM